jgi:hypothetical protein
MPLKSAKRGEGTILLVNIGLAYKLLHPIFVANFKGNLHLFWFIMREMSNLIGSNLYITICSLIFSCGLIFLARLAEESWQGLAAVHRSGWVRRTPST